MTGRKPIFEPGTCKMIMISGLLLYGPINLISRYKIDTTDLQFKIAILVDINSANKENISLRMRTLLKLKNIKKRRLLKPSI